MKNEFKLNKNKVKVLSLKNKNINIEKYLKITKNINLFEKTYFISFYDDLKLELFEYYDRVISEDGYSYNYSDLFIFVSLCISLEKYDYVKEKYDKLDKAGDKTIVSINYSLIEYYLFFSDYKSILKLLYALSMCSKVKKYILKHTLKYLKYMTDVDDELIIKLLRNILDYDLYFSFKVYRALTENINISLKEGIFKYYGMTYDEFENIAYKRALQNKYLYVVSEIYKDKNNETIEGFYKNLDSVFDKIKSYDNNKELLSDNYKFIQREFFLFVILNDFSKYDEYKNDLFNILKDDLFRPSYVYHSIDTIVMHAIKNNKIMELLENMPNNMYSYKEEIIDNSDYYKYCKHEYLRYNYADIFDYLNNYTPNEIITIYLNTSMKLEIGFDKIIEYIKEKFNINIDISNYYFYGEVKLNFMHKFELKTTNVLFSKKIDVTDNIVINNLYNHYLENSFRIRFRLDDNLQISDIYYLKDDGDVVVLSDINNDSEKQVQKKHPIINGKDNLKGLDLINFELKNDSFSIKNILNIDDLFTSLTDENYVKHIEYLESLLNVFSKVSSKSELLTFIDKIRDNNIFNEKYPIYYSVYTIISNLKFELYEKVIRFEMSLDEAVHIYLNSPLKYICLISDYLKDFFKIHKASISIVSLSDYDYVIGCFILEKKESYLVEYNDKMYNLYLEGAPDFGFVKIKILKYEVFTGKLYGIVIKSEVNKKDIKKEYENAFNKMINFKIGNGYNDFNYLYTYKAGIYNINEYIEEYQKIISDNFDNLDFLYEFLKKNKTINIFNENNDYGDLKYNRYLRMLKEQYVNTFEFCYNKEMLEKKIYVSENSFIKTPFRRMIRSYLKETGYDKYIFKKKKRLKLQVMEIGEFVLAQDEFRNNYSLKFSVDYNLEIGSYIIVDLLEYNFEGNFFNVSLLKNVNRDDECERSLTLCINDVLNNLTGLLHDNGKNISYYLERISKYSNEEILYLKNNNKKREFLSLYIKIFRKYIDNFDILNKFLICLEKMNPYDLFNYNYKSNFFDKQELLDITSLYINNVRNTSYYLEALNIYFNSFISKYVSLKSLREVVDSNNNIDFNDTRNTKVIFVKYKKGDMTYLKSYCNKLKFPIKKLYGQSPFMVFKIKERDINSSTIIVRDCKSYSSFKKVSKIK